MTAAKPRTPLFDQAPVDALRVEHVCDMGVELEVPLVFQTPVGTRVTYIIKGGTLTGARLRGDVLPGGGDSVIRGDDGISRLDIRGTIRTHDGALINLQTLGVARFTAGARDRFLQGERIPFEDNYVRTTPRFETSDERYSWLNGQVFVSVNELSANHVDFRIYQIH